MKLEALIATRYLFATKQRSVANTISWISLVGLLVSTASLIVVLSVYNGIGEITKGLFGTFDPELIIVPSEGKTFHTADFDYTAMQRSDAVECVSQIAEETAWLTYRSQQAIVSLRGVDSNYAALSGLDTLLYEGSYDIDGAIVLGGKLWRHLGMSPHANIPAALHIPRRGTTSMGLTLDQAFNTTYAFPAANFFIQQDIDSRYAVTSIATIRQLMGYTSDECTALAIKLKTDANVKHTKQALSDLLAASSTPLIVKDRYDQQPLYFKIFRTERLGIYLILSLIVLISTLSLAASLSLLIITKGRDVFTLQSLGFTRRRLRRTFVAEGLLICSVAIIAGLFMGYIVCLLQQQFGIVRMGNGNFVVDAFPVAMRIVDFVSTFLIVTLISGLTVLLTVHRARL